MFRQIIVINLLVCLALSQFKEAPYASWAHSHWVWQNGKEQNQANLENMVKEYLKRDIPVGAVNVDSAWTTGFNNFIWNNSKFPNPKGMISSFHQQNIKVIAWVTSMVNKESSNYQ
jgi:alpha-glucosidase (family GH31 glycosyl hydrolase)